MDTRSIERLFCHCPLIDNSDYSRFPWASPEECILMEQYSLEYSDWICVFAFVRNQSQLNRYIEFYVYDVMLFPNSFERFIICDGERLTDESEKKLLEYAENRNLKTDLDVFSDFNNSVAVTFPEWHYHTYDSDSVGKAIKHIYYASHQSGPREILFKAALSNIALNLEYLPSFNLIGTTPTAIVGHNAPLRFLRIMNDPRFIHHLFDENEMEHCLQIYRKYSGYIGENISTTQWLYLDCLFSNDGQFAGQSFNRPLFDRLATNEGMNTLEDIRILEEYESFITLREKLGLRNRLRLPYPDNLSETVEKLEYMMFYQKKNTLLTHSFQTRKQTGKSAYEYLGKEYCVLLPSTPFDICLEAIFQGNCVMEYIERHASNKTTILFVRKKDDTTKSFVTMEVENWQITQVFGAFNSTPSKEVFIFLMEYARSKSLYMDTYSLIMKSLDDDSDCESSSEIRRFAESFRTRRIKPCKYRTDVEYVQIKLEDLYPWLFQ